MDLRIFKISIIAMMLVIMSSCTNKPHKALAERVDEILAEEKEKNQENKGCSHIFVLDDFPECFKKFLHCVCLL